jgi:S1-C subfamily serine protease
MVQPLTPELAAQRGLSRVVQGLVITEIEPAGPAAEAGLQVDEVITEVNHQPVRSLEEMSTALQRSASRPALLLVQRRGQSLYMAIPLR